MIAQMITKIGLIFTVYNSQDSVMKCLEPWIKIKNNLSNIQFVYSCVSVPFEKFNADPPDETVNIIKSTQIMDFLFADGQFKSEVESRGICLKYLKEIDCDIVWQVDLADEVYSIENIKNIVEYVAKNKNVAWFKLSLKNYFQTKNQYLAEPFTPARIFRVNFPPYKLHDFREDNNLTYFYQNAEIPDIFVKNKTIPKEICWIDHFSWSNPQRSKKKIEYQLLRWNKCSYRWNEEAQNIEFNPDYYKNKLPEVIIES
jgi:hypothetical protein